MSSSPGPNPNVSQIFRPVADLGSLSNVVQQLKNAVDNLVGFTGGDLDRAVTFNDLVRLGLVDAATIQSPRGAADFATNTALTTQIGQVNGTITAFTTAPHTWTAEQKFTSADGSIGVLISGASKGLQFVPSASGMTIEATDNNGAGHQPLIVDASTITFQLSDVTKLTLDTSGWTVAALASFSADVTFNSTAHFSGGAVTFGASAPATFTGAITANGTVALTAGATITGDGLVIGAPTGGDKGAGSANAAALYINGVALQTVAASSSTGATGPVNSTTAAPGTMVGMAGSITPTRSGKVRFSLHATGAHVTAGRSFTANIRTGTGAAPASGAAATGTVQGNPTTGQSSTAGNKECLAAFAIVSGLVVGTTYWYDFSLDDGAGGTSTVTDIWMDAVEL